MSVISRWIAIESRRSIGSDSISSMRAFERHRSGHEDTRLVLVAAFERRRVRHTPVRGHRLARPHRAHLAGSVVADGEHEVERGCAGLCELTPAFAAKAIGRDAQGLQRRACEWIDRAARVTACRVRDEASARDVVQQAFGQDGAGRVAGADEEHVVDLVSHGGSFAAGAMPAMGQWVGSAGGAARGRGDLASRAVAAVGGEVGEQVVHLVQRRPVDQVAALACTQDFGHGHDTVQKRQRD